MKTLFLLRHASALSSGEEGGDKERKLAPQGEADARALGRAMAHKDYRPDYVLCSSAARTRQTLECALEAPGDVQSDFQDVLYNGSAGDLLYAIRQGGGAADSLLVVGHNPGIHELAALLTGSGPQSLAARLAGGYRPGTLSVLKCDIESWDALQEGKNELADFLEPPDYNAPANPARWT